MNTTMGPASTNPATQSQSVSSDEALALVHVRKVKAFYLHLAQYAFVIASLTIVNLVVSPHYFWVLWIAAGWGFGLPKSKKSVRTVELDPDTAEVLGEHRDRQLFERHAWGDAYRSDLDLVFGRPDGSQ